MSTSSASQNLSGFCMKIERKVCFRNDDDDDAKKS
jgi:hypothetical protein